MTRGGHSITGAALALAGACALGGGQAAACFAAGVLAGCNAPDWLERPLRLQHRTWTHWPMWWAGLLACAALAPWAAAWLAVAGFGAGGLLHLALDIGTPTGIPLRWPPDGRRRKSMCWYETGGRGEWVAIAAVVIVSGIVVWVSAWARG